PVEWVVSVDVLPPPVGPDGGGGDVGGGGGGLEARAAPAPAHRNAAAMHAAGSARGPMPDLEIPTSTATFEPEMPITSSLPQPENASSCASHPRRRLEAHSSRTRSYSRSTPSAVITAAVVERRVRPLRPGSGDVRRFPRELTGICERRSP